MSSTLRNDGAERYSGAAEAAGINRACTNDTSKACEAKCHTAVRCRALIDKARRHTTTTSAWHCCRRGWGGACGSRGGAGCGCCRTRRRCRRTRSGCGSATTGTGRGRTRRSRCGASRNGGTHTLCPGRSRGCDGGTDGSGCGSLRGNGACLRDKHHGTEGEGNGRDHSDGTYGKPLMNQTHHGNPPR